MPLFAIEIISFYHVKPNVTNIKIEELNRVVS